MVGPVSNVEAIAALVAFALVVTLLKRRTVRALVRFMKRRFRAMRRILARGARQRRESAAEFASGQIISRVRTVDGDTIEDLDTRTCYRVANIDCPETGNRAKCHRERIKGEQAKGAAEILFATAQRVEVRPVGRTDVYGRTVAYVRIDDRDFGRLMIEKGFAVAWGGSRGSWCGKNGGLAQLARATSGKHACKTCGAGDAARSRHPQQDRKVVQLPVRFRPPRTDRERPSDND